MSGTLQLAKAASSYLKFSWSSLSDLSEATFQASIRPSALVISGKWNEQVVASEQARVLVGRTSVEVTIRDLQPQTHYDVRLHACFPDSSTQVSGVVKFKTLPPAPSLSTPPTVKCARYDRLLLQWVGPTVQADEVVAYRVKAYEKQGRWSTSLVEAKLPPRMLRPTAQTTQFLSGEVAMRVPLSPAMPSSPMDNSIPAALDFGLSSSESFESPPQRRRSDGTDGMDSIDEVGACDEEECCEVHFWLTNLSPSTAYYVQVAAITGSGQGPWSPQSEPLETWRVAPNLQPPNPLLLTHASAAFGLELQPIESGATVQDEEIVQFEVTMTPEPFRAGSTSDNPTVYIQRQSALELGTRLRQLPTDLLGQSPEDLALFVAEVSGLKPQTTYLCKARALTHTGVGSWSTSLSVRTLAVPPGVTDLVLEDVQHNCATLTWCSSDRKAPPEFVSACFDIAASSELQDRCVRGFRLRRVIADAQHKVWTELLGIRASATLYEDYTDRRHRFCLEGLEPSSKILVQLAAVTNGQGDGEWSESLEIRTEALAPMLEVAPEVEAIGRQTTTVSWKTPEDFGNAPILGYEVHASPDKARSASSHQVCLPLGSEDCDEIGNRIWTEGGTTFASLAQLEPGTSYTVSVAARTARGLGVKSSPCKLQTKPHAPSMRGEGGPTLSSARHDALFIRCEGPNPDWGEGEESDVTKCRARYYECSRGFGPHGAWNEVDADHCNSRDGTISFWLTGLVAERQYIVQVAAVTAAGQGPWSKQSDRLSTWRVAPIPSGVQCFFRTHTALVVGWNIEAESSSRSHEGIDEEIKQFVLAASSTAGRDEACTAHVSCEDAVELAADWQVEPSTPGSSSLAVSFRENLGAFTESFTWPDTALWPDASQRPCYVAVLRGLTPGRTYTCSVRCVTAAGKGGASQPSDEVTTLGVAPRVESLAVDEVQSDQIQVSWVLPKMQNVLAMSVSERFRLTSSLEELELRGYDVRCAPNGGWRLNWREPLYIEVEMLSYGDGGRVHFAITNLEPETYYFVEARARSSSGNGEWCRLSDEPIRTAMVAEAPPTAELVYASHDSLAFAFTGVQDDRIIAYEVRHYKSARLGWEQASKPIRFDRSSPAVRVTDEKRWVVTMDKLKSDTKYALQLRGITTNGGITKWSERSELMHTHAAKGESPIDSIGINYSVESSLVPYESSAASSSESVESIEDLEKKLEQVLSFIMTCATQGVRLSAVKIPSVAEQAEDLLLQSCGDREAAIMVASKIEDDNSWKMKLPDFLIQQVPVVGCSTLLLREAWRSIRRCALIAHLYGHDTNSPETQASILTCLVPMSSSNAQPSANFAAASGLDLANSRKVAWMVSRTLAKETFVYATGMKITAQAAVALLEKSGSLIKDYSASDSNPDSTGARPEDADTPSPVRCALVVFRPQKTEERPLVLLVYVVLWLLPILVSLARVVASKVFPILAKRVQMDLPMVGIVGGLILTQGIGVMGAVWVHQHLDKLVSVPASLVFTVYALLPALSIYMAMRSIIQSKSESLFFLLLGLYNLGGGYLRWSKDVQDDAMYDKRDAPRATHGSSIVTRMRSALWIILVLDFFFEEVVGEMFNLHPYRPMTVLFNSKATLVEYRTLAFALSLVAAWAQEQTLALLQRRSVLLRLLGAKKAILAGLSLLAMGAFAVVQQAKTFVFLREISPAPMWCGILLWIRQNGAYLALALPIAIELLQIFSMLPLESVVPLSVLVGIMLGCCICSTFNVLWLEKKEHLVSDYRVLYLFPHMSSQAREKASVAMRVALKRGAQVTTEAAGEWVIKKALRSVLGYGARRIWPVSIENA